MLDLRKTPDRATFPSQSVKCMRQDIRCERPDSIAHPVKESTLCLLLRALVASCLSPVTFHVFAVELLKFSKPFAFNNFLLLEYLSCNT